MFFTLWWLIVSLVAHSILTEWFWLPATRFPNGTYCPSFLFECKNHVCVQPHWKCDGDNDCGDNSDEELHLCRKKSCTTKTKLVRFLLKFSTHIIVRLAVSRFVTSSSFCSSTVDIQCEAPFRFRCDNNRCIYSHELCNSVDDCGDGSDERQENCKCNSLHCSWWSYSPTHSHAMLYFSLLSITTSI